MKKSNYLEAIIIFTLPILLLLSVPCHGDTNMDLGSSCSDSDNSTMEGEYQSNLNILLNSLAANGPIQNGFYNTTVGKGDHKIYGLTQCRGDITSTECAACIKNATLARESRCSGSVDATIWFKWCWLRYSNLSFFGHWEMESTGIPTNDTFEDLLDVVSKAHNFMKGLASSTPNQPLMFQTAVLDTGKSGKRYGLVQCTRDLGKRDCGKCLDFVLESLINTPMNWRGWVFFASSCSMSYDGYQFYSNISTPANEGSTRYSTRQGEIISLVVAALMLLLVL